MKKKFPSQTAVPIAEAPDIYFDPLARLTPEEKGRLRGILSDPIYVKWMRITEGMRPSSNCALAGSKDRDAYSDARANARLGEIRGWELHTAAMYAVLAEPKVARAETDANFPDSAAINLEPRIPEKK